ncbi:hypothetical protein GVAV_001001 [Gurleya vavrai]
MKGNENFLFVEFKELKKRCRNVIEIKAIEKIDGFVVYAILFDPHDFPIVYAFVVSEDKELKDAVKYLMNEINDGYFNLILDFNKEIFEILDDMKIDYFVKVREVCKEIYKNEKDRNIIETLFGICNGFIKRIPLIDNDIKKRKKICNERNFDENNKVELDPFLYDKYISMVKSIYPLKEERFIRKKNYFNLQNMHEIDLDYIHNSVYNFGLIECFNGILSLLQISDEKEDFGVFLKMKLEKNKKMAQEFTIVKKENDDENGEITVKNHEKEFTVNLNKSKCSCGMFQTFLFPCVHACAVTENIFQYVSILYSKEMFLFDYNLVPVIEDAVKIEKGRYLKVAGRPKKKRIRKSQAEKENIGN